MTSDTTMQIAQGGAPAPPLPLPLPTPPNNDDHLWPETCLVMGLAPTRPCGKNPLPSGLSRHWVRQKPPPQFLEVWGGTAIPESEATKHGAKVAGGWTTRRKRSKSTMHPWRLEDEHEHSVSMRVSPPAPPPPPTKKWSMNTGCCPKNRPSELTKILMSP